MEYLNRFLSEITTLNIEENVFCVHGLRVLKHKEAQPDKIPDDHPLLRKVRLLDISQYDQFVSDYESEIHTLQQQALTEILNLSADQQKNQLQRIDDIAKRFDEFYIFFKEKKLHEYFTPGKCYPTIDLIKLVSRFFSPQQFNKQLSHTPWFFQNLMDAAMFKDSYLETFFALVLKYLPPEDGVKTDLNGKLILLYLYKTTGQLDRKKHVNKVARKTTLQSSSLTNDYRELEHFINNDGKLTKREITTFENYLEELSNPEKIIELKKLNLT